MKGENRSMNARSITQGKNVAWWPFATVDMSCPDGAARPGEVSTFLKMGVFGMRNFRKKCLNLNGN